MIAYRQPITRGEIEDIRGVSVSANIVRTLLERDWVHVVGHRDVPGRPEMFATTRVFLDYFGLKKLDDLPPLADLSDWESLRVQLNLPEVEEDSASDTADVMDLPVLYPEIEGDESDDAIPGLTPDIDEGDDADVGKDAELDALVVSEWPDPAERGG